MEHITDVLWKKKRRSSKSLGFRWTPTFLSSQIKFLTWKIQLEISHRKALLQGVLAILFIGQLQVEYWKNKFHKGL